MKIETFYLAGPMAGRKWEDIEAERAHATRLLTLAGFSVLDPARNKALAPDTMLDVHGNATMPPGALVERDLTDVETADATIVLSTEPVSFGTTFEWSWARAHGKPVFLVSSSPREELGAWRTHGKNVTAIFSNIKELVTHLEAYWK